MSVIFRQLSDSVSSTFTYLLGDQKSGKAILIDPVLERVERDLQLLRELGLTLSHVLDTHIHADHVTAAGELRKRTGAVTGISAAADVKCADLMLTAHQELSVGAMKVKCLFTPGHTSGCMSFFIGDRVFTGDALMIRTNGRTDFQGGSAEVLYRSIHSQLYTLPAGTRVYPAHDYNGFMESTIEEEKRFNARVPMERAEADFVAIMKALKLPDPKMMAVALPANTHCGSKGEVA